MNDGFRPSSLHEDVDVSTERAAVEQAAQTKQFPNICLLDVRKEFATKAAVKRLTFGVKAGDCFGLLGVF
mgnify:CR=1 FL=1